MKIDCMNRPKPHTPAGLSIYIASADDRAELAFVQAKRFVLKPLIDAVQRVAMAKYSIV